VNELYFTAGKNVLYAHQGRVSTNDMANRTRDLFQADTSLMGYFNRTFANGKWNHFMDQTHLGYTSWQDPPANSLRAIKLIEISVPDTAIMGVAVDGSDQFWPGSQTEANLPSFDAFNQQRHYVDVFNKGKRPFHFNAIASDSWILLSESQGTIEKEKRIWVNINWNSVPKGARSGDLKIVGTRTEINIKVEVLNPIEITRDSLQGFVEGEGFVSIEAEHFTKKIDAGSRRWEKIEDYGYTLSAMRAQAPAEATSALPGKDSPCLEYQMYLFNTGIFDVCTINSPTLNFMPGRGLHYAISFDNDTPQIVTLVPEHYSAQNGNADWEKSVADNARYSHTPHAITKPGYHILKVWMVDPGIVLQKLIVNTGSVKASYLGPPESFHGTKRSDKKK